jgi:hypothetical protein
MTQVLDRFVSRVVDSDNADARANLLASLSVSDAWVTDYVAKLTDDAATGTIRDKLIALVKDALSRGKTVADLLNGIEAAIIALLGDRAQALTRAYVDAVVADGGGSASDQAEALAAELATRAADPMDRALQALIDQPAVRDELIRLLTSRLATDATFLASFANSLRTSKPARDGFAAALGTVATANPEKLVPFVKALLSQAAFLPEITKSFEDDKQDAALAGCVTSVTKDTSISATKLSKRALASSVVEGNMLEAILLVLEFASPPHNTADLANIITTKPAGKPLKTALGLP